MSYHLVIICRAFNHENIVQIFGVFITQKYLKLVVSEALPYNLNVQDSEVMLHTTKSEYDAHIVRYSSLVIKWMIEVAVALNHFAQRNTVHKDVRVNNICVCIFLLFT